MKRYIQFFAAACIGICSFFNMSNAIAATPVVYVGQRCWSITQTQDELGSTTAGPFIMKLGVTNNGGPYRTVQGTVTEPDGSYVFVNGGIIVTGSSKAVMTGALTRKRTTGIVEGESAQINFNLPSWNGTWWTVRHEYDPSTKTFKDTYGAGTATHITCP